MGYLSPSLPARQSPHWRCRDCCRTRSWAWWWICAGGGLGGSSGHDGELVRGWRPAVPPPPGITSTATSPGTAVPAVDVPTVALQLGAVCFGPRDTRHIPAAAGSVRKMLLRGFGLFGLLFCFSFPEAKGQPKAHQDQFQLCDVFHSPGGCGGPGGPRRELHSTAPPSCPELSTEAHGTAGERHQGVSFGGDAGSGPCMPCSAPWGPLPSVGTRGTSPGL